MARIGSKLEFLYSDALSEIQDLVSRLEAVHASIPRAAGEAGDKINTATGELRGMLDELSQRLSATRQFTLAHMLFSALGGAVVALALMAATTLYFASRGSWVGDVHQHKIVDAVDKIGIDITTLSAADLRARLSFGPEDGRVLVELFRVADGETQISPRDVFGAVAVWLKDIPAERRRKLLNELMRAVKIADNSPAKAAIMAAVDGMLDEDAWAMADSTSDIRVMVHQFASLPNETRRRLVAGNFFCAVDQNRGVRSGPR